MPEPNWKPVKGTALLERRARRAKRDAAEKSQKAKVVARDGSHYCRLVPQCQEREKHETAHVRAKSLLGGSDKSNMLRACLFHHRGNWSIHSGDLRVVFLTDQGTDGPIEVWSKRSDGPGEFMVGREKRVGLWERD